MHSVFGRLTGAVGAVLACAQAAAAAQAWWDAGWAYRRPISVERARPSGLPGDDAAVMTFPTAGAVRADGADIRVVADDGAVMPCRVLQVGPGDQARVAFAVPAGPGRLWVYFDRPDAVPPPPLDLRRGVLHEAWQYPGGRFETLADVRAVLARASRLLGRTCTDRIFIGHDPFDGTERIVSVFTAHLPCAREGEYFFACTSRNASFLLIDGRAVVSNGGRHGPGAYEKHFGRVRLGGGLHRLEVLHVSDAGDPVVATAWIPPRGSVLEVMPAGATAPILHATAGVLEARGGGCCSDFDVLHVGEAWAGGRPIQRLRFRAAASALPAGPVRWVWDFGDGQRAAGEVVEHVYLSSGQRAVTLTCRAGGGDWRRRMRVMVDRPWPALPHLRSDDDAAQADIVARYEFAALAAEVQRPAVELLWRSGRTEATRRACRAVWLRPCDDDDALQGVVDMYVQSWSSEGGDAAAAKALLADEAAAAPHARAALLVEAGRIYLDHDRADEAMRLFEAAVPTARGALARRAMLGIGDVWRSGGQAARAAEAYAAATDPAAVPTGRADFRRGDFARTAEDLIRTGQLRAAGEALGRWERAMPADKLEGFWSLYRVRLLLSGRRHGEAAREAETLLRVNSRSPFAAELLMLAGQAHAGIHQGTAAAAAWRRLAEQYPESAFAAMARDNLRLSAARQ